MAAGVDESRLEEYREQYERDPNSLVFALLAEAYRRRGQLDEAEEVCANGLKTHPAYVTGHLVMGDILIDRRRLEQAEKEFKEVLRLDPNNPVGRSCLARIHLARGDPDRAIEQLELVLFLYPSSGGAQQLMEQALRMRDEMAGAVVQAPAAPPEVPVAKEAVAEAPPPAAPAPPAPAVRAVSPAEAAAAAKMLATAPPPIAEEEMVSEEELSAEQAIFLAEREEEFVRALGHAEGIREAIVVGREGLIVTASARGGAFDDVIAASITQIFHAASDQAQRMGFGDIENGVVESEQAILRMVRMGDRVLAALIDPAARLGLVNLHINNAVSHIRHLRRRT